MVIKDWDGMRVRGPKDTVYVITDDSVFPVKTYVKDEGGNVLFETVVSMDDDRVIYGAEIAIQWAIDYQSSIAKVKENE